MRLARGVANNRRPFRKHRRHQRVLGAGDARLVEKNVFATQTIGANIKAIVDVNFRAERAQRVQVRIEPPPPDHIAAWWRQGICPIRASIGPANRMEVRMREQIRGRVQSS